MNIDLTLSELQLLVDKVRETSSSSEEEWEMIQQIIDKLEIASIDYVISLNTRGLS